MAFITLQKKSTTLDKCVELKIFVNENAKPPYPSLYLLHGLGGDASDWARFTVLERTAEAFPFLIVMPDGGRDWYCDSPLGAYETFFTQELVPYIDGLFRTRKQKSARGIGGLSMGGYGALHLALKHPQIFGSATVHSAAVHFAHDPDAPPVPNPQITFLRDHLELATHDLYALAKKCPTRQRPQIRLDCGREDFLFAVNEDFHKHLETLDFAHTYLRFKGEHNWDYWNAHLAGALAFHAKAMGLRGEKK